MKRIVIAGLIAGALALNADDSIGWQMVREIPAAERNQSTIWKFRDGIATCYVIKQVIETSYGGGPDDAISCVRNTP